MRAWESAGSRIGADRVERTAHVDRQEYGPDRRETRTETEDVFGDRELQSWPVGVGCLVRRGSIAAGYIPMLSDVRPPADVSVESADENGERASRPAEYEPASTSP